MTMTCAANVQAVGKTWPGELGVYDDKHIEGLKRLASGIREHDSLAVVQIFHGGLRAPAELIGNRSPVAPSADPETGARALSSGEVKALRDDFIAAAVRCERAGFDGVELHGAHGYLLCQFLSPHYNRRNDEYGGNSENRARLVKEIIRGIRAVCGKDFCLGIRLSPENHGLRFTEMLDLARDLMSEADVDFLDLSIWDVFKNPDDEAFKQKSLMDWYAELPRGEVRLGVAGKLQSAEALNRAMSADIDFVIIGRAAIYHHDLPAQLLKNPAFEVRKLPVSREVLFQEGLSETFINYLSKWPDFVA